MRIIIVEDVKSTAQYIAQLVAMHCPLCQVVGIANRVSSAKDMVEELRPDLILLDIKLPDGTGFDLLSSFPNRDFEVIFLTAYDNYAINAIKMEALDYILKPIGKEEFVAGMLKARKSHELKSHISATTEQVQIGLPTANGLEMVSPENIIRVQASRSYCEFHLTDKKVMVVAYPLNHFEQKLKNPPFCRVHKSHLVNIHHIHKYVRSEGGYLIMCDGSRVDVSRRRKNDLLKFIS